MQGRGSSRHVWLFALGVISAAAIAPRPGFADGVPGADNFGIGPSEIEFGSLAPVVTESGLVSLSLDASGSNGGPYDFRGGAPQTIRVQKPAGATVRRAFVAAASTGFSGRRLNNGDVTLDGVGFAWAISTPSSISSWNHWAEVTTLVKPKIDAAAPGIVSFNVGEVNTTGIDGEILAVIFDDPSQTTSNTVILLFGAQNIAGDTFNIALGSPINKADPQLAIDLSLGISFGFQTPGNTVQHSIVNVNGQRLTSLAGGQDDGQGANGALITVGGIGDSNDNPPPFDLSTGPREDDELYNLLPFVANGATSITVFSQNPSNDDNILFAALNLRAAAAIVGEGIVLGPSPAPDSDVGTPFTVTATVQDANGHPVVGRAVTFSVSAGPDAGDGATVVTDATGHASFTYEGAAAGVDEIQASFIDSQNHLQTSNTVIKRWIQRNQAPTAVCQNVTRAVNETCVAVVQPAEVGGGSFDPDGDPISLALNPAGPFALGQTSVIMTATDIAALSSQCAAVITAVDQTPPTLSCAPASSAECTGNTSAVVNVPSATSHDNCGPATVVGPAGNASYPLGSTPLTFSATDGSGNTATCTTNVTVVDTTPPTIACAAPLTAECTGNQSAAVNVASPTASDVCSSVVVTGPAGTSTYPLGTTPLGFAATDVSGNHAVCSTSVTVRDTTPPNITCPAPIIAECTGGHAAPVDVPDAFASDVCTGVAVTGPAGTSSYSTGTTTIGFTATDTSGNAAACSTDIIVVDTTPPTIACAAPITTECTGNRSAQVDVPNATASDVCGGVALTGPAGTAGYPLGTTTLGFAATDDFGNLSSCTTSVTVADTTPPVFDPASLGTRTVLGRCDGEPVSFALPTAIDSCQGVTVACTPLPGNSFGANTVTCTATDGSGNHTDTTLAVNVIQPMRLAFQAPLSDDNVPDDINTDADVSNVFEVKRTIPNQIKVFACDGTDVTVALASSVTLRLTVNYRNDTSSGAGTAIVPIFTGVGDAGGVFVLTGDHFQYNQKTDPDSYPAGSINNSNYFDNVVTLTYNAAPSIVAGQEDARLESK